MLWINLKNLVSYNETENKSSFRNDFNPLSPAVSQNWRGPDFNRTRRRPCSTSNWSASLHFFTWPKTWLLITWHGNLTEAVASARPIWRHKQCRSERLLLCCQFWTPLLSTTPYWLIGWLLLVAEFCTHKDSENNSVFIDKKSRLTLLEYLEKLYISSMY